MQITIRRYIEIPAPLATVRELLATCPPLGAEQGARWWSWQGELWSVRQDRLSDTHIVWRGCCPALPTASFVLSTTLHDAVIATHIELHLTVELPSAWSMWLPAWRRKHRIATSLDHALRQLQSRAAASVPPKTVPVSIPSDPHQLAAHLRGTHPHTVAAFEAMDALPRLADVARLDERWQATASGAVPPDLYRQVDALPPAQADFDLIYAGGGLGLLHAAVMAQRYGCRVLLFDRDKVGCAHREWNISDRELRALVDIGFCTQAELETVVMRRYRDGIVRFWPERSPVQPAELHLPEVLNVSLDAAGLLRLARRKLEAAGGTILDHRTLVRVLAHTSGKVAVELKDQRGVSESYGARLLIDGMGATSPLALQRFAGQPFAAVCPTVGTVVSGLEQGPAPDQHHPDVGDILVSVADTQGGRQLIWEGFGGRGDELTVYLFYYDLVGQTGRTRKRCLLVQPTQQSLLDLFEDYFRLLPTYKRPGPQFKHVKPVYGFIPARHTQRRSTRPPLLGVLPVGDSSAQQSPLTFCGFGSHVRNLQRTTALLAAALSHDLLGPHHLAHISAYQANVALNWVFSRFMQPWQSPNDVNLLQNIFARVLNELGIDVATRFFQDQMRWRDYSRIVNGTLAIYRPIIATAITVLGPRDTARWLVDWLRFSWAASEAALGRVVGKALLDHIESRLWRRRPAWALKLSARRAEWRAGLGSPGAPSGRSGTRADVARSAMQ